MTIIGLDQVQHELVPKLKGMRVGLITSNMSRSSNLVSTLEIMKSIKGIKKLTLLSPEHGYFSEHQAGVIINPYFDEDLQITVESLYRKPKNMKEIKDGNIDLSMRTIDSKKDSSKYPPEDLMKNFDTIVCDLQDVGCRIYTYVATMIYSMEISGKINQDFIILDRPNPITGRNPEGPLLQKRLFSFIGAVQVPIRHSLTLGEIALYFNRFFNKEKTHLSLIKMKNWKRDMWYDKTKLPWVMPSPNMPTLDTATVYPGMVMLEGTNVSEGRGTTKPFQVIGAPWINGMKLKRRMSELNYSSVQFMEMKFRPMFSKYAGEVCSGIYVSVKDRDSFRPFEISLAIIRELLDLYPDKFALFESYFDRVAGNKDIRKMLLHGYSPEEIVEKYRDEIDKYTSITEEILIYK